MNLDEMLSTVLDDEDDWKWNEWKRYFAFCKFDFSDRTGTEDSKVINKKDIRAIIESNPPEDSKIEFPPYTIHPEPELKIEPKVEIKTEEPKIEIKTEEPKIEIKTEEPDLRSNQDKIQEWREEYDLLRENPPQEGDLLMTETGENIKLNIELNEGKPPFIFGRIYLPSTVLSKLGWFAQSIQDPANYGWKAILTRKSRDDVIKHYGLGRHFVGVQKLIVKRRSGTGDSIVCDIYEW